MAKIKVKHPTEVSTKYRIFRASRHTHKTHIISGSGNTKGKLVLGHVAALAEIQSKIGRQISVHDIRKNRGCWLFYELR